MSFIANDTDYVLGDFCGTGDNDFTAMAWIYPTTINQLGSIWGAPGGDANGGAFMIGSSSVDGSGNQLIATSPGAWWSASSHTFTANSWYHVTWTVDTAGNSTTGRLYKNGAESSLGNGRGINVGNTNWGFGKRLEGASNWRQAFTGRLSHLKVWNTKLSQAQIQSEMHSTVPLFRYDELKIYLPCDNLVLPATYPEYSGNDLVGTPQSNPVIADNPPI